MVQDPIRVQEKAIKGRRRDDDSDPHRTSGNVDTRGHYLGAGGDIRGRGSRFIAVVVSTVEPVTELAPEPLHVPAGPIEEAEEPVAVVIDGGLELGRRWRLLATTCVGTAADPVVFTRLDPFDQLAHPADGEGVRQVELGPEAAVTGEEVVFVVVVGGLLQEGVRVLMRLAGGALPGGARGSAMTSAAARSQESSAERDHSRSARYMALAGRPNSSERGSAPSMNCFSSTRAVV